MASPARSNRRKPAGWIAVGPLLLAGCAGGLAPPDAGYRWFESSAPGDVWSPSIRRWQARQRDHDRVGPVSTGAESQAGRPDLGARWHGFVGEQRRALARAVAAWVQDEARAHYVTDGSNDVWPSFEETLAAGGDDCDGLELLAYRALRALGFPRDRLFRAILRHPGDDEHHMVTLWFESGDDPWVIDPTGTASAELRRMSELPAWEPLRIFTESREYGVHRR